MKIIIADDHPVFRSGLKFLLESSLKNPEILAVENGQQVIENMAKFNPDVVFLDVDMPIKNGLETSLELSKAFPSLHIIILSIHKSSDIIRLAFANGASGYLIKDNTAEEIVECLSVIQSGKKYLPHLFRTDEYISMFETQQNDLVDYIQLLTPTELKVLKLVGQKYSSKEISDLLFVSTKSVENYRSRICKKLNLDARNNSLLMWVLENKYLLGIQ
jgi:DNA-binding NarL/FixJ family response regulator